MIRSLLVLMLMATPALAQIGAPSDCSGTAGTSAAAVSFGHNPSKYVTIANPATSGTTPRLAVNPGGTAVDGGSGSFAIFPGGSITWAAPDYPPPITISIIASAGSTPYTCKYQ